MATTILDTLKKLGAATFDRLALLVGVVDDDPATYADGDVKPLRIHKTNRGVFVHVANAEDIVSGGGGTVNQGTAGLTPWLIEISHPIETDGQDYVVVREKFSEATRDAVVELNDKTPPRVATTAVIERGTANTTSAPLPAGAFPDGFTVANLSTDTIIYWQQGTAVASTGYPIFPETEEAFENADPSEIELITSTGSADWALKGWA